MRKVLALLLLLALVTLVIPGTFVAHAADQISVNLNGKNIEFPDAKPFIDKNNRTLLPIRFVSEALGANVLWNDATKEVKISLDSTLIILRIGNKSIIVDGLIKQMDTEAIISDSRTYVPIRFVGEGLGANIQWDPKTKTVFLTTANGVNPGANPVPPSTGQTEQGSNTPISNTPNPNTSNSSSSSGSSGSNSSSSHTETPPPSETYKYAKINDYEDAFKLDFSIVINTKASLEPQYKDAENFLNKTVGTALTTEIMSYVKQKSTPQNELAEKNWQWGKKQIQVASPAGQHNVTITAW